jgi:hypothetical protein
MKILIIRPAALGDTLMLAPALSNSHEWGEVIVAGDNLIDFLTTGLSVVLISKAPAGMLFSRMLRRRASPYPPPPWIRLSLFLTTLTEW